MQNIEQLDIDKYLNWYEGLSKKFPDYVNTKSRIQRLKNAVKYLESRVIPLRHDKKYSILLGAIVGMSPNDKFKYTIRLGDSFQHQITTLEKELNQDLDLYFNPELSPLNNCWYIPSNDDWIFFHHLRDEHLQESIKEFRTKLERSILTEKALIEQELELINYNLFTVFNYYENVRAGTPLLKDVLKQNAKINGKIYREIVGEGWGLFAGWVYDIDFGKWLYSQLNNERTNSTNNKSPKQTVEGIAMFYWYLWKGGEDGLSNSDTLTNAVETFGVSRKTLQNKWNGIIEREITIVPKNTNERKEKHNRLLFAYFTLKERSTNKKAIILASQYLQNLKLKWTG